MKVKTLLLMVLCTLASVAAVYAADVDSYDEIESAGYSLDSSDFGNYSDMLPGESAGDGISAIFVVLAFFAGLIIATVFFVCMINFEKKKKANRGTSHVSKMLTDAIDAGDSCYIGDRKLSASEELKTLQIEVTKLKGEAEKVIKIAGELEALRNEFNSYKRNTDVRLEKYESKFRDTVTTIQSPNTVVKSDEARVETVSGHSEFASDVLSTDFSAIAGEITNAYGAATQNNAGTDERNDFRRKYGTRSFGLKDRNLSRSLDDYGPGMYALDTGDSMMAVLLKGSDNEYLIFPGFFKVDNREQGRFKEDGMHTFFDISWVMLRPGVKAPARVRILPDGTVVESSLIKGKLA